MNFERVRVFDFTEVEKKYPSDEKFHIEFVYNRTKYGDLMHMLFGDVVRVKHSRHFDDRYCYRPQNYRDFLLCLKSTDTHYDGNIIINSVIKGALLAQPLLTAEEWKRASRKERKIFFLDDDEAIITPDDLIEFASEYLKDDYLSEEKQALKKEEFIFKCKTILEEKKKENTEDINENV